MEEVKKLKNKARREQKLGEVDTYLVKMEGLGEWEVRDGEEKTKEPYSIRLALGSFMDISTREEVQFGGRR